MGGNIILRRDVVPHIFVCHKRKESTPSIPADNAFEKQQRQCKVETAILESKLLTSTQVGKASTSKVNEKFVTSQTNFVKNESDMRSESIVIKELDTIEIRLASTKVKYKSVGVQTIPHYCSKYTQCNSKSKIAYTGPLIQITACKNQGTSTDTSSVHHK